MNKFSMISLALVAVLSFQAQARPAPLGNTISVAINSTLDARVKYFAYNEDVVYTLPITVGMHTHIALGKDEHLIEKPKMGETIQWRVSGNEKNLYIRALRPDIVTSLTLITDKRSYQFELVSTTKESERVQKAYFTYPDDEETFEMARLSTAKVTADAADAEAKRLESQKISPPASRSELNFSYEISGSAPFRPTVIYDDGTFTHMRFPKLQDLPAVFFEEQDGKLSPLNYVVKESEILIERVATKLILKLGKSELVILKVQ